MFLETLKRRNCCTHRLIGTRTEMHSRLVSSLLLLLNLLVNVIWVIVLATSVAVTILLHHITQYFRLCLLILTWRIRAVLHRILLLTSIDSIATISSWSSDILGIFTWITEYGVISENSHSSLAFDIIMQYIVKAWQQGCNHFVPYYYCSRLQIYTEWLLPCYNILTYSPNDIYWCLLTSLALVWHVTKCDERAAP
jgi:hypothetical protein